MPFFCKPTNAFELVHKSESPNNACTSQSTNDVMTGQSTSNTCSSQSANNATTGQSASDTCNDRNVNDVFNDQTTCQSFNDAYTGQSAIYVSNGQSAIDIPGSQQRGASTDARCAAAAQVLHHFNMDEGAVIHDYFIEEPESSDDMDIPDILDLSSSSSCCPFSQNGWEVPFSGSPNAQLELNINDNPDNSDSPSAQLESSQPDSFPRIPGLFWDDIFDSWYFRKHGHYPRSDDSMPQVITVDSCPEYVHKPKPEVETPKELLFADAVKEGNWRRRLRQGAFPGARIQTTEEEIVCSRPAQKSESDPSENSSACLSTMDRNNRLYHRLPPVPV